MMNYATEEKTKSQNLHSNSSNKKASTTAFYCVSWLPDGKAFVICDVKEFTKNVVPKFFKASKFSSFTRKRKYTALLVDTTNHDTRYRIRKMIL